VQLPDPRSGWQLSIGISGNLPLESVATFDRNRWQLSIGISGNLRPEYAINTESMEMLGIRPLLPAPQPALMNRVGGKVTLPVTGSPEAVTHLRLPRNVASGFPVLRSSASDSQHSHRLQCPVGESQPRSLQRPSGFDPVEDLPRDTPFPTPTAQHLVPVSLHSAMLSLHGAEVPGNAVVGIVPTQHLVEMAHLVSDREVPHASHQVAQVCEAPLEA
jgi:hypothetical protein